MQFIEIYNMLFSTHINVLLVKEERVVKSHRQAMNKQVNSEQ